MSKKKYPPGFMPVNFNAAGKAFLVIGAILFLLGFADELLGLSNVQTNLFVVGLVFEFAGLYLVFVVPKE